MIGIIGAGLTGLATANYYKKDYVLFVKEHEEGKEISEFLNSF